MSLLPSLSPLIIGVPASVAAAWWLPRPAAIGAITALLLGALSWPVIQQRRRNVDALHRERKAREDAHMAPEHPELLTKPASDEDEDHLARWCDEMWPASEFALIVDEYRRQP